MSRGSSPPNRIPWPPVLYVCTLSSAYALHAIYPLSLPFPTAIARVVGAILFLSGLAFDASAMLSLYRHKTTILPNRSASSLVTSGVYAISRNPIYFGNALALTGIAIGLNSAGLLVLIAACTLLVSRLAIDREEAHLAQSFPVEWTEYCRRVRRWI